MKADRATDAAAPADKDLSSEICLAVGREPGEIVRCTRVGDHFYRCNWWRAVGDASYDNPSMRGGQLGTTYRVTKSSFLEVHPGHAGLEIRQVPAGPRRPNVLF